MKVGDIVLQREWCGNEWRTWDATVTKVENNFIETEFERDWRDKVLVDLANRTLAPYHRTFTKITIKNYFSPSGGINIEIPC